MKALHAWDLTHTEAAAVQSALRGRLQLTWDDKCVVGTVAGVDASIGEEFARCAIVVLKFPELTPIEGVLAEAPVVFPYIPGLLAFREGPAVLAAWEKLTNKPDLVMFDGQGIAHPRGMGIASHLGLWLERPTIGVAKSRLFGRHQEVGPLRGDRADLLDRQGDLIGAVLRTKERTNPLYISPGHMIDVRHSVEFVMDCLAGYRLPETTRWAHNFAGGRELPGQSQEQPKLF